MLERQKCPNQLGNQLERPSLLVKRNKVEIEMGSIVETSFYAEAARAMKGKKKKKGHKKKKKGKKGKKAKKGRPHHHRYGYGEGE